MRQLFVHLPTGKGPVAGDLAQRHRAVSVTVFEAVGRQGEAIDVLVATVPNVEVESLVGALETLGEIRATIPATGVYAFAPPASEPPDQLIDVTPRSAIEVFLAGRQSAGSWRGFLTYAFAAGLVVWIGLTTETVYLLTASMLLAPFAGPAMNAAIGVASGDLGLLRHSTGRYLTGIATTAAVAAVLTWATSLSLVPSLMVSVLTPSGVAVLLPLAAGLAGGTHLVQSEHSSLVSGAAVGMLVAASLAPPTGALGVAAVLARWDLFGQAAFLVALQLVAITLVAALVFRWYGVSPDGHRFGDGRGWLFAGGLVVTAAATLALLWVQLGAGPSLQRGSIARAAAAAALEEVERAGLGVPLHAEPLFTSRQIDDETPLVLRLDVQAVASGPPTAVLTDRVRQHVGAALRERFDVPIIVDPTVHSPPVPSGT